jgi:predicted aspartyl protease
MLTLLAAVAVSACSASVAGSKYLPFQLVDSAIVIPVVVDGQGPFRFLLDTGASQSVLSERLTERLGLVPTGRTRMLTPTGHRIRPVVSTRLDLGGVTSFRVVATVVDDEDMASDSLRLDGIVGQDVLATFTYTIDYARRVIDWDSVRPVSGQHVTLSVTNGRATVLIPQAAQDDLRLIPDTGSDSIVLFARPDRRLPAATPRDVSLLRTIAGHRLVRRVQLTDWRIGDLILRDQDAVVLDASDVPHLDADGLLALHGFSRVTFDARGGNLWIEK